MSIPFTREQLRAILSNCVKASGLKDAYVEMITTRGLPESGSRDPRSCTNQFFAFAIPFVWITKPQIGLNLVISQRQRIPEESIDPVVKNYHWLDLVMGQYEAYDLGGETTALIDGNGNITEGPGFNIFVVKDSVILTPRKGILQGITRKTAIELAAIYGYEVIQADVSPDSVRKADEVFATSTAGGIMPITKIDSQTIGSGDIGSVTQKLQEGYWALHEDRRYTSQIDNA